MPLNILCVGSTSISRMGIFLTVLPFIEKKYSSVDFISIGKALTSQQMKDLKRLEIETFSYQKDIEEQILTHQVFNEDLHDHVQWFEASHDAYDNICPDKQIFLLDREENLVKWYQIIKRYAVKKPEEKAAIFLEYWQRHITRSLFRGEDEPLFPGIWQYRSNGTSVFCLLSDEEVIREALELYYFLCDFYPQGKENPLPRAEKFLQRIQGRIIPLSGATDSEKTKNWAKLRRFLFL